MPYVKRTSRFDNKNVFYLLAFWQGSVGSEGNWKEGGIREGTGRTCEVSGAGSCVLGGGKRKRTSKEGLKRLKNNNNHALNVLFKRYLVVFLLVLLFDGINT